MLVLLFGIVIFLGAHTFVTMRERRSAVIGRWGEGAYRGGFTAVSLLGFVLIIWGFVLYRQGGYVPLWTPPAWLAHLNILLMWPAMVLLAVSRKPGVIRAVVKHPMLTAVKIWALGHLLANGDLGLCRAVRLVLAWAVYDRISVKRRGEPDPPRPEGWTRADTIAVGAGTAVWLAFHLRPATGCCSGCR